MSYYSEIGVPAANSRSRKLRNGTRWQIQNAFLITSCLLFLVLAFRRNEVLVKSQFRELRVSQFQWILRGETSSTFQNIEIRHLRRASMLYAFIQEKRCRVTLGRVPFWLLPKQNKKNFRKAICCRGIFLLFLGFQPRTMINCDVALVLRNSGMLKIVLNRFFGRVTKMQLWTEWYHNRMSFGQKEGLCLVCVCGYIQLVRQKQRIWWVRSKKTHTSPMHHSYKIEHGVKHTTDNF